MGVMTLFCSCTHVRFFSLAHITWDGVGWGRWRSFLHFHTCEPLHVGHASHGVGWGGDAYLLCTTKYYSSTTLYYKADSVQKTPTSTVGSLVSLVRLVRFFPWFVGSLVRWFVGPFVRWFVGSLVRWFRWFVGALVRWFVGINGTRPAFIRQVVVETVVVVVVVP